MSPNKEKPNLYQMPPHLDQDNNRIDVNLIAMLLWQALLVACAVTISHLNWYLPDASPSQMGLQYGLITFGFLCASMVLFHVGGVRDSLAMRAEFSRENQTEKWMRSQMRLQQRRAQKEQYWANGGKNAPPAYSQFGYVPNANQNEETPPVNQE
tara:strand:+ start:109 stop:570 length:462 start_codon:yes stop_codon:yes gene_type:complete